MNVYGTTDLIEFQFCGSFASLAEAQANEAARPDPLPIAAWWSDEDGWENAPAWARMPCALGGK